MQVRGQSVHSPGRVGGQTECHQKAIPRKTFFKKKQNQKKKQNYFYHLLPTNVNVLISAFIIYNCPKKFFSKKIFITVLHEVL